LFIKKRNKEGEKSNFYKIKERKGLRKVDLSSQVKQIKARKSEPYALNIERALLEVVPTSWSVANTVFFCIGTDRSTGDALGPMVGRLLEKKGYQNVIGTMDHPVHAVNLNEKFESIPKGKHVLAIDACLGKLDSVGFVFVEEGGIKPGAGVKKELMTVGDVSIKGVINIGGFMEYLVLGNTRLSVVMNMAEAIADGISLRFSLGGFK
jgi:putative sporulation protein YyaC